MRIIGIRLFETEWYSVNKILKPGWYPFGNYPEPEQGKVYILPERTPIEKRIYDLYENNPHIEVSCLVGMNGSGKSTLLDILYRLINNFAFVILGERDKTERKNLSYANGLMADLYYELDESVFKLVCRDSEVGFFHLDNNGLFVEHKMLDRDLSLFHSFFYTISTNYSLYSLNYKEYEEEIKELNEVNPKKLDGEWIKTLFNKNDGYLTPIVITPYREMGSIDVEKENRLALRRIISMAVLSSARSGPSLIDGYKAYSIKYRINRQYRESLKWKYLPEWKKKANDEQIEFILGIFREVWQAKLGERLIDLDELDPKNYSPFLPSNRDLLLDYLAFKTFKICTKYDDYVSLFDTDNLLNKCQKTKNAISHYRLQNSSSLFVKTKGVVDRLCDSQYDSHINLKIRQCLSYLDTGLYQDGEGEILVADLLKDKQVNSLDDATILLPPSYFDVDVVFARENAERTNRRISISSMSSGERQMLYSLSYVLYHLKNIQSVKPTESHPGYNHVNLVFDEAELYYHPDYQRQFVKRVIEYISRCNLDKSIIKSINIIIATHSPFVLSDMLTSNTLYLSNGQRKVVEKQTFGANYYDMLHDSFFFDKNAIGEVSTENIKKWLDCKNSTDGEKDAFDYETVSMLIGDPLIVNYLLSCIRFRNYVQD